MSVDTNEHLTAVTDVNSQQIDFEIGSFQQKPIYAVMELDELVEVQKAVNTGLWVKVQLFGQGRDQTFTFSQEIEGEYESSESSEDDVLICVTSDAYFDFFISR